MNIAVHRLLSAAFLLIIAWGMMASRLEAVHREDAPPVLTESMGEAVLRAQTLSSAFRATSLKVIPSVVKIITRSDTAKSDKREELLPFGDFFPDMMEEERIEGVGSGVLVDPKGVIITNDHVISDSNNIRIELFDGRVLEIDSVQRDTKSDLAVIKLKKESDLPFLEFADSDQLEIGEWVLAIGNPFMLESSVSAGIVSAKRRFLGKKDRGVYIQTDAAVNPGNSGGPLVTLDGKIVGINTAIASLSGGYQGIGFAIPSNTAAWVMKQLVEKGKVERAFLGIPVEMLSYQESQKYGIPPRRGVRLGIPFKDSPAAHAGLRSNDILLAFDETEIDSLETLELLVESAMIDQPHQLKILRGNSSTPQLVPIQLEIKPDDYVGIPQAEQFIEKGKHYYDRTLGAMLIPVTPDAIKRLELGDQTGVVVLSVIPSSPAWKAGLREGMVILSIDGNRITDTADLVKWVTKESLEKGISLEVKDSKGIKTVTVQKK